MKKKYIKQLYDDLPNLVSDGVLSEENAKKLKEHYGKVPEMSGSKIALTIFSILGSLLIGGGIILLIAHNWQGLTRFSRTLLSFAPLLAAQVTAVWIIHTGKNSVAWREGVGTFLVLSIAASIALIGQTYNIPGDLGSFLFTWMLLSIPVVYILRASVPCIIYFIGITFWSGYAQSTGGHALFFWLLLALALPHIFFEVKKDPYSNRSSVLGWAVSLCLCIATGITLEKVLPGLWTIIYSALFAIFYLAGSYWFWEASSFFKKPFQVVGASGIAVLSLLFTFDFPWDDVGWSYYRNAFRFHEVAAWADYLLLTMLVSYAVFLLVISVRREEKKKILFGVIPVLAVIAYGLSALSSTTLAAMMLFNLYMFALGLGTIFLGIRFCEMGTVNGGMLILSMLILARFFDSDLGFVVRGVGFILVGIGFLVTNIVLTKKQRQVQV